MIEKFKVACFSGHSKLPQDHSLKKRLRSAVIELIDKGVIFYGAGGAMGFDMLAEEIVLELREEYPQIKLILVLPCCPDQQTLKWNDEQHKRYNNILKQADKIRILSPNYTCTCMLERNRHMADNSAYLVCYLRKDYGGTYYTVKYAKIKGLNIIRL